MPTSLTLGYKDLKSLRSGLAGSAQQIDPIVDQLKGIKIAPDLKPNEVAQLMASVEVLVKLQLRREFPILERVLDNLLNRLQNGDQLKPLSAMESRALVSLVDDLSDAENEALNLLHNVGVIKETEWKDIVEPHRAESNKAQRGEINKVKWGMAVFANGISPAVAAVALSLLIPGLGGTLGAVAMATGMGLAVSPKISSKIQVSSRVESRTQGMNVVQGRETVSEPVLLTGRLADGEIFKGDIADNLRREAALANLLLESREAAGVPWGKYEQQFLNIAGRYQGAVEALLAEHDKTPMKPAELRREMYDVRAQLMAPAELAPLVQLVGAVNVPTDDNTRLIVAHRQMANLFKALGELSASGAAEAQGTAQFILNAVPLMDEEVQGAVTSVMRDLAGKVAKGTPLDAKEKALLKDAGGELSRIADGVLERNGLQPWGAEERAKEVVGTMLSQVLPAFGDDAGDPKFRDVQVTKQTADGFVVNGAFKSGLFGQEGSFAIEVKKDGTLDIETFKLDVGPKRARSVAEAAARQAVELLTGNEGSVHVNDVRGNGKDNYTVDLSINGKRSQVAVTPMGLVDWASIKV